MSKLKRQPNDDESVAIDLTSVAITVIAMEMSSWQFFRFFIFLKNAEKRSVHTVYCNIFEISKTQANSRSALNHCPKVH